MDFALLEVSESARKNGTVWGILTKEQKLPGKGAEKKATYGALREGNSGAHDLGGFKMASAVTKVTQRRGVLLQRKEGFSESPSEGFPCLIGYNHVVCSFFSRMPANYLAY